METQIPRQPLVLIADDTPSIRTVLQEMVCVSGYRAALAEDGNACLASALAEPPDLILLDIMMPGGMDGFQTFQALQQEARTRTIPVIFLTGMDDLEMKLKGFEMGAVDYITKPFHMVEVQARLRLHLKMSYAFRSLVRAQQERLSQIENAQRAMLVTPESEPDAKFTVRIRQLQEAGGDFYDVLPLSEEVKGYFIADVSGHDVGSGFITPAIKALLRQNCTTAYSPMESMTMINQVLAGFLPPGKYLTAAYLTVDRKRKRATLVNMGHLPLILKRKNGETAVFKTESDVLGAFPEVLFAEQKIPVAPGDRFYLYSDGLIEGTGLAELWTAGIEPLCEKLKSLPAMPLERELDALIESCGGVSGLKDDLLLIGTEV